MEAELIVGDCKIGVLNLRYSESEVPLAYNETRTRGLLRVIAIDSHNS